MKERDCIITTRITQEAKEKLTKKAEKEDRTIANVVRRLIDQYIDQ